MQSQEVSQRHAASAPAEEEVNAIALLKSQHREVEALFGELEDAGARAVKKKKKLFESVAEKLTLHTKLEESIFYPEAKEADEDLVLESLEEHANVKSMIRKLQRTEADDETFDAKISVLKELVQHHVSEEENELFPKCQEALGTEALEELGKKMKNKQTHLEARH